MSMRLYPALSVIYKNLGWNIHRIYDRLRECLLGDANSSQFLSSSMLLDHKRCCNVNFADV